MQLEVYTLPHERHVFHPEAQPLLSGSGATQFDLAACAEHALPRKLARDHAGFQKARDGAVIAGVARGGSHLAIGRDLSRRDGTDGFRKGFVTGFSSNFPDSILVPLHTLILKRRATRAS
jgi:hypothetical protein